MAQPQETGEKKLDSHLIDALRAQFHGTLITPQDEGYAQARMVWNGMVNKHPALILRAADVEDIVAGVRFAREHDVLLAVRGGGHGVAGYGTCDGGLVLDLGGLKEIQVDPARRIARAQPGLRWGDLDRATQEHGLATPGGAISDTGIAGLTLGGGLGWLSRQYGLTCDNLLSVEMVTADAQVLTASATENTELFWAMRGAGANFGVVSRFEYQLHPVGPMVLAGMVVHPASRTREVLAFYNEFIRHAPTELSTAANVVTVPPSPATPQEFVGRKALALLLCYCGDLKTGEDVIKPLRAFGSPVADMVRPMPYVAWQSALDGGAPRGVQNYWKSAYVDNLSTALIDLLVQRIDQIPAPLGRVNITHLEGAIQRVPEEATAFGHRDARFIFDMPMAWPNPAESERNIAWTRQFHSVVDPYTRGVYVNFLGDEGQQRVIDAYGQAKYRRLAELKRKYDPTNLFRSNQNIKPSAE